MTPEGFLADVLSAPGRLAATLDAYEGPGSPLSQLPRTAPERVVLVGMGSSRFAALPVAARLRAAGVAAVAELASTSLATAPSAGTLAVGISASGRTAETVEALARHRGRSLLAVAVTNDPASPLAEAADLVLPLHSGEEGGGVACVTFQATLAVLLLVTDRLVGDGRGVADLWPAVDASAALRDGRSAWLDEALGLLDGSHTVYTIAPASRLSSALQSALMLREGPRRPADATETGDWLHVDVYLTKHGGYRALLFTGSRFDADVMRWARERRSTVIAVGGPVAGAALSIPVAGAGDERVALLVEVGAVELLAAEWWRRLAAAGGDRLSSPP